MVMKKIIVALLLIAASTHVKAQQLTPLKPDIKLNDGTQNLFKPLPAPSPKDLLLQTKTDVQPGLLQANKIVVYSNMPVVKLSSTDRMPVVVSGDPNTKYTMLVKKVEINTTPTTVAPQP